jgi:hypothetical protein
MPVRMPAATGNFSPPPEGTFIGICYRVVDLGTQETTYKGQIKHQRLLLISWELPDELMEDGRPFTVSRRYTYSSSSKSNLRKDLESWRGKRFTDAEIEGFDVATLLGVGCMLNVAHSERDGTTYANIGAIVRLPKGTKVPQLTNGMVALSLDDRPFDWHSFEALGERLQEVIKKAPEFERAVKDLPAQDEPPPAMETDYGALPDEDVPF